MSAFHKRFLDPGRDRTCNLLIRSQTRYPLRHKAQVEITYGMLYKSLLMDEQRFANQSCAHIARPFHYSLTEFTSSVSAP